MQLKKIREAKKQLKESVDLALKAVDKFLNKLQLKSNKLTDNSVKATI